MKEELFRKFLWENHRDIYTLLMFGHDELLTDELIKEFENWRKTKQI